MSHPSSDRYNNDLVANRAGFLSSKQIFTLRLEGLAGIFFIVAIMTVMWFLPQQYAPLRIIGGIITVLVAYKFSLLWIDILHKRVSFVSGHFKKDCYYSSRGSYEYFLLKNELKLFITKTHYEIFDDAAIYHAFFLPLTKRIVLLYKLTPNS